MIDDGHVLELCAPYALGALAPDETIAVEAHCATCVACGAELAEMIGIASTLPLAADAQAPSVQLKSRILGAARRDAGTAASAMRRLGDRRVSWTMATAAAAAAVIVAAIGIGDDERLRSELASMQQQAAQDRERIAMLQRANAHGATMIASIAHGRVWDKSGGLAEHWWHCTIVQPADRKKAMLLAMMPAAPRGMTYQAWVIRKGAPHAAGIVPGGTTSMMDMPMPLQLGDVVAFTVEPMGGSRSPTMPYVMTQTLL